MEEYSLRKVSAVRPGKANESKKETANPVCSILALAGKAVAIKEDSRM